MILAISLALSPPHGPVPSLTAAGTEADPMKHDLPITKRVERGEVSDLDFPQQLRGTGFKAKFTADLLVAPDGRVSRCQIKTSTGSSNMDVYSCLLITKRFKFRKILNSSGQRGWAKDEVTIVWADPGNR